MPILNSNHATAQRTIEQAMRPVAIFGNKPTDATRDRVRWLWVADDVPPWLLELYRHMLVSLRARLLRPFADVEANETPDVLVLLNCGRAAWLGIAPFRVGRHPVGDPVVAGGLFAVDDVRSCEPVLRALSEGGAAAGRLFESLYGTIRSRWEASTGEASVDVGTGGQDGDRVAAWWRAVPLNGDQVIAIAAAAGGSAPCMVFSTDLQVDRKMARELCAELETIVPTAGVATLVLPGSRVASVGRKEFGRRAIVRLGLFCLLFGLLAGVVGEAVQTAFRWLGGPAWWGPAERCAMMAAFAGLVAVAPGALWVIWLRLGDGVWGGEPRLRRLLAAVSAAPCTADENLRAAVFLARLVPWCVAAVPVLVLAAIVAGFAWLLGGFPMAAGVLLASGLLSLFGGVLCCLAAGHAIAGVLEFLHGRSRWTRVLSAFAAGWGILCGVVPLWECVRGPGRVPATWGVLSAAVLGAIYGAASQKLARMYVRRTGAVTYRVTTADVS